ncbi:MAG: hypothetical protein KJO79_05955 [Verrucomicrobiae bacterium]|nr:hypothetical protein [Verrucomicrobiae bacterium]NNJ86706.1 hypothetical protein [Akkermansiaceae bacterium]
MKAITPLLWLALLILTIIPQAVAQSVAWGGSASTNPVSYDSHGNVDIGLMTWELGWFSDGYIPESSNAETWAVNWNTVAIGSYQDLGGLYAANLFVDDPLAIDPSAVGKTIYTFVHNGGTDKNVWGALMGTPDGEALIYTQNLTYLDAPAPTQTSDIADNPLDATDDELTVIWGRIDRNMYADADWGGENTPTGPVPANGGVIQGGGVISNPVADSQVTPYDNLNGVFENQTATWVVVPEPSSAIFGAVGIILLLRHRRLM